MDAAPYCELTTLESSAGIRRSSGLGYHSWQNPIFCCCDTPHIRMRQTRATIFLTTRLRFQKAGEILMTRLRFEPHKTQLRSAGLLGLGLFLFACGGGGSGKIGSSGGNQSPPAGPNAILNGAALASATSHWTSAKCGVQVELTSDNGFYSVVVDSSGKTSSGTEKWAVGPDPNSVTVGPGNGLGGFFWVSALKTITGSTTSQTFSANVSVETGSTIQSLGVCTFVLVQAKLS